MAQAWREGETAAIKQYGYKKTKETKPCRYPKEWIDDYKKMREEFNNDKK